MTAKPLVVDLDGTLVKTDLLAESAVNFIAGNVLKSLCLPLWLSHGKPVLKAELARRSDIDVTLLPYNQPLIALLQEQKFSGRRIVLATASHRLLAERVAEHLGIFDEVIATETQNLKGKAKRDELVRRYGEKGFDYAGNDTADLDVWPSADKAWLVNASGRVEAAARRSSSVESVLPAQEGGLRSWAKAVRPHQWVKNLLIFVPLVAAHQVRHIDLIWRDMLAFLFFGLCASGIYLLNDLADLQHDRQHRSKRLRPFASGALPLHHGLVAGVLLFIIPFLCSLKWLPGAFTMILAFYYVLTLAYSLALKRLMSVDVIVLAVLYTMRIIAGTFVIGSTLTFWLLAFSMFMFLSLALMKRYTELHESRRRGSDIALRGRGYVPEDLGIIASLGAMAGYLSVMVLAFYIQDLATAQLYRHPQVIWLACPLLLLWITRIWILTYRGQMHDDPIVFALTDSSSLVTGALFVLIFSFAA